MAFMKMNLRCEVSWGARWRVGECVRFAYLQASWDPDHGDTNNDYHEHAEGNPPEKKGSVPIHQDDTDSIDDDLGLALNLKCP